MLHILTICRLVDNDEKDLGTFDKPGELWVKGPTVMLGYLGSVSVTQSAVTSDGWLKTGDICYRDERTLKWYILDRKKVKVYQFSLAVQGN